MERYLKFVKMKSEDGKTISPPACCLACKKMVCPLSCPAYAKAMKSTKCTQFEMEFGLVDGGCVQFGKAIRALLLLVLVGCIPLTLWLISKSSRQNFEVAVDRVAICDGYGSALNVSHSGGCIDTNAVLTVIDKATKAMSKEEDVGQGR